METFDPKTESLLEQDHQCFEGVKRREKKKKISCPWFLNLPLGSLSLDLRGGSLVLQSFLMNLKQQLGGMEDVVLSTLYSRSLSTVRSQG